MSLIVAVGTGTNAVAYSLDHGLTFKGLGNPGFSSGTDKMVWYKMDSNWRRRSSNFII